MFESILEPTPDGAWNFHFFKKEKLNYILPCGLKDGVIWEAHYGAFNVEK